MTGIEIKDIVIIVLTLIILGGGYFYKIFTRGTGEKKDLTTIFIETWPIVRDKVLDILVLAVNVYFNTKTEDEVLDDVINLVQKEIQTLDILSDKQKEILSDEKLLKLFIQPMLHKLWNKYAKLQPTKKGVKSIDIERDQVI